MCFVALVALLGDRAAAVAGQGKILVPGDINAETALCPQKGLDQTVDVVVVCRCHFGRAVDEGLHSGHLPPGALHGDADGLAGVGQKGLVEDVQRQECGVQLGNVADAAGDTQMVHRKPSRVKTIVVLRCPAPDPGGGQSYYSTTLRRCHRLFEQKFQKIFVLKFSFRADSIESSINRRGVARWTERN